MSGEIQCCRICGSPNLESVIDLGMQALTGIFPKSTDQEVPIERLELVRCTGNPVACGLVQLRHSCDPALMYGSNYGYRSGLNPSMVRPLSGLAQFVTARVQLAPGDIALDIGSNDGTLLRALAAPGVTLTGIDPTADKFRQFYPSGVNLICDLFSADRFREEYGGKKAKSVTSIAMFYDLESPVQFMREVAEVLADDGIWTFEQSYLPSMIENDSYDTICHEHLEYYALSQIRFMAERSGLSIADVSFNASNGGSFRVIARHAGRQVKPSPEVETILRKETAEGYNQRDVFDRFRDRVLRRREELMSLLHEMRQEGLRVFGYGASTKGNVILQYCGLTSKDLPMIAEVNPDKFGCFTPKSLIPIAGEAEVRQHRPDAFLVLPWHFREFIIAKEHEFLREGGRLIFPLPVIETVMGVPNSEKAVG
jgi:NDP-4-keto-2,6-dideoxyhexose 3-C-methyltransferase